MKRSGSFGLCISWRCNSRATSGLPIAMIHIILDTPVLRYLMQSSINSKLTNGPSGGYVVVMSEVFLTGDRIRLTDRYRPVRTGRVDPNLNNNNNLINKQITYQSTRCLGIHANLPHGEYNNPHRVDHIPIYHHPICEEFFPSSAS